jgi:hypothetical protein
MGCCTRCRASHNRSELVNGMDERARAILCEAFAMIERSEAERDELLADISQRQADEVIYPKRQPELPPVIYKTTEQPKSKATDWEVWEARLGAAIQKSLEDFAVIMGAEAAQQEKRIITRIMTEIKSALDEIKRLDLEIAALRNEIAILRTAKNVTPLRALHG